MVKQNENFGKLAKIFEKLAKILGNLRKFWETRENFGKPTKNLEKFTKCVWENRASEHYLALFYVAQDHYIGPPQGTIPALF